MVTRAKHPCAYPLCGGLAPSGTRYCETHAILNKPNKEAMKRYDDRRGTSHQRGYDGEWKKIRDRHIQLHPLCEDCLSRGIVNDRHLEVHHIKPKKQGGTNKEDNLVTLCFQCHKKRERQP